MTDREAGAMEMAVRQCYCKPIEPTLFGKIIEITANLWYTYAYGKKPVKGIIFC